jgi:hypothetical protein
MECNLEKHFQRSMSYDWSIKIGVMVSIGFFLRDLGALALLKSIFSVYFTFFTLLYI